MAAIDIVTDVAQWVDDPVPLVTLLENKRNERYFFEGNSFSLYHPKYDRSFALGGLTRLLGEALWPQESDPVSLKRFKRAGRKFKAQKPQWSGAKLKRSQTSTAAMMNARGFARGTMIHRQVNELMKLDVDNFFQLNAGAHPWTVQVLQELDGHGIRVITTEFPVGRVILDKRDPQKPVVLFARGTRIDMIGVNKRGELQFIELKTGYESEYSWTGVHGQMRAPLHNVYDNTELNRAAVQCIAGTMLCLRGHKLDLEQPYDCWVVRVNSNGPKLWHIDRAVVGKYGPVIYQALVKHEMKRSKK
jgi:hypothetical protein